MRLRDGGKGRCCCVYWFGCGRSVIIVNLGGLGVNVLVLVRKWWDVGELGGFEFPPVGEEFGALMLSKGKVGKFIRWFSVEMWR